MIKIKSPIFTSCTYTYSSERKQNFVCSSSKFISIIFYSLFFKLFLKVIHESCKVKKKNHNTCDTLHTTLIGYINSYIDILQVYKI